MTVKQFLSENCFDAHITINYTDYDNYKGYCADNHENYNENIHGDLTYVRHVSTSRYLDNAEVININVKENNDS